MKLLIFDNYDSFTYNIVHAVRALGVEPSVARNDQIDLREAGKYDKIIISPGPGIPSEAGILKELLAEYAESKSILGVCLGHQAIAARFGGSLINLPEVFHGIKSEIDIVKPDYIFESLPDKIDVGRYHSWAVDRESIPEDLEVTAVSKEGCVMALRHKEFDVRGVQFHPESILTPEGNRIIENWLKH
ncbi:MAG: aminodeoxychorismate/anthranilate synthase component II [Paramuribaculum sp.]|nr:aminodeoxychorismate/anthranilate synthase component II [Paramuribaculum sp.]